MSAPLIPDIDRASAEFGELVELSTRLGFDLSGVLDSLLDRGTPVFGVDVDSGITPTTDDGVFTYKLAERLHGVLAALRTWDRKRDLIERCVSQVASPYGVEVTPEMIKAGLHVLWDSGAIENPLDADRIVILEIFLAMLRARDLSRSSNSLS